MKCLQTCRGFNTSHVSINRKLIVFRYQFLYCFNTSHVSINLSILIRISLTIYVSIHLMFLLIKNSADKEMVFFAFQYISCFHLSLLCQQAQRFYPRFNTSHVSINQNLNIILWKITTVSIHLMFLLICEKGAGDACGIGFNTSHVSINPYPKRIHPTILTFQYISCFY